MKELETAIVAAFNKMAETGAIQTIIENKIEKTVADILDGILKSYSDFGKNLATHIQQSLNVDLSQLGLVGYNDIVLKIIKAKLDDSINIIGKNRLEKELSELLVNPPAEIKLSQLVTDMKESYQDRGYSQCTCIVEDSAYSSTICQAYLRIYLDAKEKDKNSCEYRLGVTDKGEVYSFNISGRDPAKTIFVGPSYGFDRALFQMYTAKTKLIVDEDEVERYYPGYDD
jgi:hypothetical protein